MNLDTMIANMVSRSIGIVQDIVIPLVFLLFLLVIVWWVAKAISRLIINVIWKNLNVDKVLEEHKLKDALLGVDIKMVFNTLLFIYLLLIGMILAMDLTVRSVSGALEVQVVLKNLLGYMSSLFQGAIILIIFLLLADLISDKIRAKEELIMKEYIAMVVQAFIAILGFVIAMPAIFPTSNILLLGNIVLLMFGGIVLGFGLAVGLAFGLGGQDVVAKRLEKFVKEKFEK